MLGNFLLRIKAWSRRFHKNVFNITSTLCMELLTGTKKLVIREKIKLGKNKKNAYLKIIGLLSRNTKFKQPQWCVQCLECWWGHCLTGPSPLKLFVGTSAHWFLSSPVKSLQKKRLLRSASLVNIGEIGDDFTIWFKSNWVSVSRLFLTAAKF